MNRNVRPVPSLLGLLTVFLAGLGSGVASAQEETGTPAESAPTPPSDVVVQALVVGGTAFAVMIATAFAVLFYTARRRRHVEHG
ncbi:hypothetical protein [Saccharomonospora iraqiensis]|uniref:hypothetical protein n=1 Tax=Saccharomonospora iraqiensis TaxID=52698 RepID=UPI00022DF501|nr:hypothetical protein [Saccharomonospora iraqiensis]